MTKLAEINTNLCSYCPKRLLDDALENLSLTNLFDHSIDVTFRCHVSRHLVTYLQNNLGYYITVLPIIKTVGNKFTRPNSAAVVGLLSHGKL